MIQKMLHCLVALLFVGCSESAGTTMGASEADPSSSVAEESGEAISAASVSPGFVDAACLDGQYAEVLPRPEVSIDEEIAAKPELGFDGFILAVLDMRYPHGKTLVERGLASEFPWPGNCIDTATGPYEKSFTADLLKRLPAIVVNCASYASVTETSFFDPAYLIGSAPPFMCEGGSTATRGGATFSRSRINEDSHARTWAPCPSKYYEHCLRDCAEENNTACSELSSRPKLCKRADECSYACIEAHCPHELLSACKHGPCYCVETCTEERAHCDGFASILSGDPEDATADIGDAGFASLLSSLVLKVDRLATAYAFGEHYEASLTGYGRRHFVRDSVLANLWYLTRYLRLARTAYPEAYEHLVQDSCWREALLTAWGRAWLFVGATGGDSRLGPTDGFYESLAGDIELIEEVQRIREHHGCAAE